MTGAELNHGGRTPGGFMYYFLYVIMFLGSSPEMVMLTLSILFLIMVGWLAWTVIQIHGVLAGVITANVMLASLAVFEIQQKLFNPAISMIIGLPGVIIFFSALVRKNARYIPISVVFLALAAQAHLSWIVAIVAVFIVLLWARVPIKLTTVILSLIAVVVCYAPYIVHELVYDFGYSKTIAQYVHIESRRIGIMYEVSSAKNAIIVLLSPFRTAFGLLSNVAVEEFESRPLYSVLVFLVTRYLSMLIVTYLFFSRKIPGANTPHRANLSNNAVTKALFFFILLIPGLMLLMGLPTINRCTYSVAPVGAILAGITISRLPTLFSSHWAPSKARIASFCRYQRGFFGYSLREK